ncbi:hypothetical protein JXA80_05090 [bacterium]|nr:hypothetical protein [candidate division CSSED10-310 bacterium]
MNRLGMMLAVFSLIVQSVFATGAAGPEPTQDVDPEAVVWFDGRGAYHQGGLLSYLNNILAGVQSDPCMQAALKKTFPGKARIDMRDVRRLAVALDPLTQPCAILYPDSETLQTTRSALLNHFAQPPQAQGTVTIKSFGIQSQGNVALFPGSSSTNILMALPADPVTLAGASNAVDGHAPVMESVFLRAAAQPEWVGLVRTGQVMATGETNLFNLHPGPWVLYLNQYGVIVQCYRMIVQPGANQLIADKTCFQPSFGKKTESGGQPEKK